MMKKNKVAIFTILSIPYVFSQALVISEIMYNPKGADGDREWVEIYNDTASPIDLTGWKFFENNVNHSLSSFQGGLTLESNVYAVIADNPAKFLLDYPSYTGILIDASFDLNNSGEYIAIKDQSSNIKDSLTYVASLGGSDDTTTLSLLDGAWLRGDATPGASNVLSTLPLSPKDDSPVVSAATTPPASDLIITIPEEKTVVAGADSEFSAQVSSYTKKTLEGMNYTWAFGDGGKGTGKSVGYHYHYPGLYIAAVEASGDGLQAAARMRVKVIHPDLSIKNVGQDEKGVYVDLANNSTSEVDLSLWFFTIDGAAFPLPKNTFIAPKQTVRFAGSVLGFASSTFSSSSTIKLMYPNHEELLTYKATSSIAYTTTESPLPKMVVQDKKTSLQELKSVIPKSKAQSSTSSLSVSKKNASTTVGNTLSTENASSTSVFTVWFKKFLTRF